MNGSTAPFTVRILCIAIVTLTALLIPATARARSDDAPAVATNNAEADKAWLSVRKAGQPPLPPAEWQQKEPTRDEVSNFYTPRLIKGADAARDFYIKFPEHPKAAEARALEFKLLTVAAERYGDTNQTARLEALQTQRLNDPKITPDERYHVRLGMTKRLLDGLPATMTDAEKSLAELRHDFPERPEPSQWSLMLASDQSPEKAQAVAKEILAGSAPEEIKAQAKGILARMDALGKPVAIQFAALDGRDVDLAKLKGKVVLIDFWATWCSPCVGEIPHVKEAYEKLHAKGFEIVGISFDEKEDALRDFIKDKEMAWPQYFDGKGWGNKFGQQYGINSIPAMWLVDKKGNLRDMEARGALEEKVAKLLAEE